MTISPVPTTRVSDVYVRSRLMGQLQSDQLALFRVQSQLTTGYRLSIASEDAPAALRAISLQRLIERRTQIQTNVSVSQSYLTSTDAALGSVSSLLASVRGTAVSVTGATATDVQRTAAAQEVARAIDQLLEISNQQFRGRYIFSGSRVTQQSFQQTAQGVVYKGDVQRLQSFSDLDVLFDTNVTGDDAFGGISAPAGVSADLNPALRYDTPLSALRGGLGVTNGSIAVSDGTNVSVVDIKSARTIGDVARLIELNPPAGRQVRVEVTGDSLRISLDSSGGGNLTVTEVGGGITARELGIFQPNGVGTGPLNGTDLNPTISELTRLEHLLGRRASGTVQFAGLKNDLVLEASENGAASNGIHVTLVDDDAYQAAPGITAGNEFAVFNAQATAAKASLKLVGGANDLILTATTAGAAYNGVTVEILNGGAIGNTATAAYDSGAKRLTLTIDGTGATSTSALIAAVDLEGTFSAARDASSELNASGGFIDAANVGSSVGSTRNTGGDANTLFVHMQSGESTGAQIMAAINAEGTVKARLSPSEDSNNGNGIVLDSFTSALSNVTLSGGSGVVFDKTSGLKIRSGESEFVVDFSTAETVEDMLNILNGLGAGLEATLNATRTGISIATRTSGVSFAIAENGGETAAQLGVSTFRLETRLADLNQGRGVNQIAGADFTIRRKDGVELSIDLGSASTIQDVVDLINNNSANLSSGIPLVARLRTDGNGIELVNSGPGLHPLQIRRVGASEAAWDLGLIAPGSETSGTATAGAKGAVNVVSTGSNNDLRFETVDQGEHLNGVTVRFIDSGAGAGAESVVYDANAGTLTFDIDSATTTATRVTSVLALDATASALFSASLVQTDGSPNDGSGLVQLTATGAIEGGTGERISGSDVNPIEVKGAFSALYALKKALETNDLRGIERAVALLDQAAESLNFVRSEVGARQQSLDVVTERLQIEDIELRSSLSNEIEVDLATAISEYTARQAALEASLRTSAQIYQLTLLNFL